MSEVKKRRPPTYYTIAKYIGQKCRSNAIARFDGTCGLPKCREWVSKYDAELVLQFTEALAINPKSEAAKVYYNGILKDFKEREELAAKKDKEAAELLIAKQQMARTAAREAHLHSPEVNSSFSRFQHELFCPLSPFLLLCLNFPSFLLYAVY